MDFHTTVSYCEGVYPGFDFRYYLRTALVTLVPFFEISQTLNYKESFRLAIRCQLGRQRAEWGPILQVARHEWTT